MESRWIAAIEFVKEQYKQWQYIEMLYSPEYNGMDEEVEARTAEGRYEGAKKAVELCISNPLRVDMLKQHCDLELEEELRKGLAVGKSTDPEADRKVLDELTTDRSN